ncbi:50S ribosomal protein (macronuclear) [Tetrahymena thermophila SB210]|uniref:50S ribosomal protein n=1 Tax=Tetrahymena thermophila (strain SB210) TaxID=312017 RepID=I7MGA7_TETTS|nr:50S ribosomal protein [Tetrahymena thermophila SB210]EAR84976.2 50S ribosomal protein [Tetrahymena thermophila SB210]|eukprot:XP_001032639.2 50S ribosomal protein [Tetrahymena thermophila SB210]
MSRFQGKFCFQFKREGKCQKGDDCEYSHTLPNRDQGIDTLFRGHRQNNNNNHYESKGQSETQQDQEKTKICRFHLKGNCQHGDNCKYLHTQNEDGQANQEAPNKEDRFGERSIQDNQRGQQQNQHNEDRGQDDEFKDNEKTKICRYYLQGNCTKGDECKFLHQKDDGEARPKKVCYNFQNTGFCKMGDRCKFSHDDASKVNADNQANQKAVNEKDIDILNNQIFKFSIIDLGKSCNLTNPKDIFPIGQRQLVAFFENGFLILRMITKKTKQLLEMQKKTISKRKNSQEMEEEDMKTGAHFSQHGLILEVLKQFYYPIKKIIADKIIISAKRWIFVSFQNPLTQSYGFLVYDLNDCTKNKVTKCAAVDIAHSQRINSAEFCLKSEVMAQVEQQNNFTDQYKNFGTQNDLENELIRQKNMKQELKIQKKQDLIMNYIIGLENEIDDLFAQIDEINADDSISQDERDKKTTQLQEEQEKKKKILYKYQDIYDSLTEEQHGDQDEDGDDQEKGDNKDEDEQEQEEQKNEENQDQYDSYSSSNVSQDDFYKKEFYEEDEDLIDEIEEESVNPINLDSDDEQNDQKSDLADNFYFKSLIIESEYATSLDELVIFTSSKDGMVKVWNITKVGEEADCGKQESENQEQKQRPRLRGTVHQDLQANLTAANNNGNLQSDKTPKLNSHFEYQAIINEDLSLNITENILSKQIIKSIKQVTIIVKSIPPEPNKLNRILLLGGEQGKMYSIGLNFSLSKVSQIGTESQVIDEFYISKQNQIFCILNSYESSQIIQIGHDSSSLVDEVKLNIDSFHVSFEEESKIIKFYYGNSNQLVMIKTKVPEKKLKLSEEEMLEMELQKIQNEIILESAQQDKERQNDQDVQDKAEESNKESQSNNEKERSENQEENKQKSDENQKEKEGENSNSQIKTVLDFTQPYKIDFKNDEKLFSKELGFKEKIHRILEIKIKNKQVLFALVMNKNKNITQDCYLFNFECKSGQRNSYRSRGQNDRSRIQNDRSKGQEDRSRSRSNLNVNQTERNFRGANRQFAQIQREQQSGEQRQNQRRDFRDQKRDDHKFQDHSQNKQNEEDHQGQQRQHQQNDRQQGFNRQRNQSNRNSQQQGRDHFQRRDQSQGDRNTRDQQGGQQGGRFQSRFKPRNESGNRLNGQGQGRNGNFQRPGNSSFQNPRNGRFNQNQQQGRNNSRATRSDWNSDKINQ